MAELQQFGARKKRGGIKSKKLSTRVDLTPMVDLGFLLITFFIFTTTMSQAKTMNMVLPDDRNLNTPNTAAENKTLSLLLGADNKVIYYSGLDIAHFSQTDFSASGLRSVIREKKKKLQVQFGNPDGLIVLIKPTKNARYQNVVDVLDEMLINDVRKYMMLEVSKEELSVVD